MTETAFELNDHFRMLRWPPITPSWYYWITAAAVLRRLLTPARNSFGEIDNIGTRRVTLSVDFSF